MRGTLVCDAAVKGVQCLRMGLDARVRHANRLPPETGTEDTTAAVSQRSAHRQDLRCHRIGDGQRRMLRVTITDGASPGSARAQRSAGIGSVPLHGLTNKPVQGANVTRNGGMVGERQPVCERWLAAESIKDQGPQAPRPCSCDETTGNPASRVFDHARYAVQIVGGRAMPNCCHRYGINNYRHG